MNGGVVTAKSSLQKLHAMSSMEAELIALCDAALTAVFVRALLAGFNMPQTTTKIYEDNQSAKIVAESATINRKARHIPLRYFKVRDLIQSDQVQIEWISSENNVADCLTKNVGPIILSKFITRLVGKWGLPP